MKEQVRKGRERIYGFAKKMGLTAIPSATNFVTIDCGRDTKFAKEILAKLLERGIFIRMPGVEPQSRCIRVSVGLDHEMDLFEQAFEEIWAEMT